MRSSFLALTVVSAALPVMALAPPAAAAPGDLTLVSASGAGVKGNNYSGEPSLSADGSRVAFWSVNTNLHPTDTDIYADIYLKNRTTGALTLVSTSDTGVKGDYGSQGVTLLPDGTKMAFESQGTNLDAADTDLIPDIFVKDLVTGNVTLVSVNASGVKGNNSSNAASPSVNGTRVAFGTYANNLHPADTDLSTSDVYVKDLVTGSLVLASTSDSGAKGNDYSGFPSLSADGTKVAFYSYASNLDPADTDTDADIYVKNLITGDIVLASTNATGTASNGTSADPSLSADGTKVAFWTTASNLHPADGDVTRDIVVKDLVTGHVTVASTSDTGVKGLGDSNYPSLSAHGTSVSFTSQGRLDPADPDGLADVYVKDLGTGDVTLASVNGSGTKANGRSQSTDLSADGRTVVFTTNAWNLNPGDQDGRDDIYLKELPAPDSDGDGVADTLDNCPTVANPAQADTDGDGVGNACDTTPNGDTDGDGVDNSTDNCPTTANAGQLDTDGDGVGNACDTTPNGDTDGDGVDNSTDNCPTTANAGQLDTDGDGTGDACDATPNGDTDGDGVDNASDNCPTTANAGQVDTDGDGAGNACDTTPNGDTDGDGVDNASDNCPTTANAGQVDTDGDGAGNACDTTPNGDADSDGVDNEADNCPTTANAGQADADGDGTGDACDGTPNGDADSDGVDNEADNCPTTANAGQVDTDGDGAGNACDSTPNGDADSDGVDNEADNCPTTANAGQVDTDGDGAGDACDPTPNGDADGDGVDDEGDNCPDAANPDQADADGDGTGDACDVTPNGDADSDGVDNEADNCPTTANAGQVDTDGDGAGDACDPTPNGDADGDGVDDEGDNCPDAANPDQADADGDGAGDACDGTPNGDTDLDGDGVPNDTDSCPSTSEDLDGNQDGDGCPENAAHDVAIRTFASWARANRSDCGSPCTVPIRIRIANRGTHRETDVPYSVVATAGPARTYSSACTGNAALVSRDRDLDPGETVVVRGCTVTYSYAGIHTNRLTVHHGSTAGERFSDDVLANNTATAATRVR